MVVNDPVNPFFDVDDDDYISFDVEPKEEEKKNDKFELVLPDLEEPTPAAVHDEEKALELNSESNFLTSIDKLSKLAKSNGLDEHQRKVVHEITDDFIKANLDANGSLRDDVMTTSVDDDLGLSELPPSLDDFALDDEPLSNSSNFSDNDYYEAAEVKEKVLEIDEIISTAISIGASDIHISPNDKVCFTLLGDIVRTDKFGVIESIVIERSQQEILTNVLENDFIENKTVDTSYVLQKGKYKGRRVRLSMGRTFGKPFMVMRVVADDIPSLTDLGVEDEIYSWSGLQNGLVLMNGPTGQGKSTTLAAIIKEIQYSKAKKIITIEKPVEFVYGEKGKALITQIEVGRDARSYRSALTSALRQAPNIILLGEARDRVEMSALLDAAETGHLAISTMHTNSAASTIQRFMKMYENDDLSKNLEMLSEVSRGFANQTLLKSIDEQSRFAVREILSITPEVKALIARGDVKGIKDYQIEREATMEHKLVQAVIDNKCRLSEAREKAVDSFLFDSIIEKFM